MRLGIQLPNPMHHVDLNGPGHRISEIHCERGNSKVQIFWESHKNLAHLPLFFVITYYSDNSIKSRECVSTGAAGARTRRSLGHHLLHPLILRILVLCAPAVLRPRALQDAPAPADPNS